MNRRRHVSVELLGNSSVLIGYTDKLSIKKKEKRKKPKIRPKNVSNINVDLTNSRSRKATLVNGYSTRRFYGFDSVCPAKRKSTRIVSIR